MSTTVDEFGRVIPANAPLASSRERGAPRGRSNSPPRYGGGGGRDRGGGGGGGRGRSRSKHFHHSRERSDRDHRPHGHHSRDRDRGRDRDREWRKRPRSPSSGPPSSAANPDHPASSHRPATRLRHPCYRYVDEPMVCEYVWKSQQEGEANDKDKDKSSLSDSNNNNDSSSSLKGETASDTNGDTEVEGKESYDDYRKRYCLNYVRSFFNTHMDDSWFRNRYSPLNKKRVVLAERSRANQEAQTFFSQAETSVQQETPADGERCSFVKEARLGGGVKTTAATDIPIPKTHCLSLSNPDNILHITDIPPHVTDEQLTLALMDHCMVPADDQTRDSPVAADGGVKLVSGSVSGDKPKQPLWREAYFICSAAVKQDIIAHLIKAEAEVADPTNQPAATEKTDNKTEDAPAPVIIPRKRDDKDDKNAVRSTLPLDVECSDSYGRLDVDADGKGGAPEDGVGVPPRKSTVWVHTQYKPPPVLVLSAAVSSKERLGQDKEAAMTMARALDAAKDIAPEHRLDGVLDRVFGENRTSEETEDAALVEDSLDITIAYLRRVHLFSFYNGCTYSYDVADVLSGRHPAGTVHMRLKNADEILAEDQPASIDVSSPPPKDLLVSRLDDSIAKALEETNEWINSGGGTIVSEREDQEAAELERAEEDWKATWLENHAVIDDDGRARCSFHFCHKLFKDKTFLRKHLQKKHKEFLRAEQGQLHDEYMMKAWDEEDKRPVPPVLVDCGANFDLHPSPVVGAEPMAVDPEPELWRKEEERRKREEELQQQRIEQRRNRENAPERHSHPAGEERRGTFPPKPVKNFVDVDDMKEEKVEMSFDAVDVPIQPPKKKKKKKKLL